MCEIHCVQIPSCANSIVCEFHRVSFNVRIPSCAKSIMCEFQRVSSIVRISSTSALFVRLEGDLKCFVALLAVRVGVGICSIRPGWQSFARYGLVSVGVLMQVPSIMRILLCAFFYALYHADYCADFCAYTIVQISCTVQIPPSSLCRVSHCAGLSMRISSCKFYLCVPISIV